MHLYPDHVARKLAALERDIAVIRSNYVTREDLRKTISDQNLKITAAMVTFGTSLSGIAFFIACNVR